MNFYKSIYRAWCKGVCWETGRHVKLFFFLVFSVVKEIYVELER